MQILEYQSLYQQNLLSYKLHLPREQVPSVIRHMLNNIESLGIKPAGKIIFTEDIYQYKNIEILIPVDKSFASCEQFEKKAAFRLINAVSARHEGDFSALEKTEQKLLQVIRERACQMITVPYYNIIRLDPENLSSTIIDIYIGINYNLL